MSEDHVLVQLLRVLERSLEVQLRIEHLLNLHFEHVTGGTIRRIGNPHMATSFPPLGPGVAAKFQVTPAPAGVVTEAANAAWSSSDETNFPAVMDPSDPTGCTADVTIPAAETETEAVTLTWTYTNADSTIATASAEFDLVGGTVAPVDVTGGTIARIA